MLIIAGSPNVNIQKFIALLRESTCDFEVQNFSLWQPHVVPQGFVYIKVLPEVSFKCINKINNAITFDEIKRNFIKLNNFFIDKISMPEHLQSVPVLVLNGFVDFETDMSQFYNHLFYLKKFFQAIQDKKAKEMGTYVAPKKHSCGKC